MSDFTWTNTYDGTTGGVDTGGSVALTVAPNSEILLSQNLDQPGGQTTLVELFGPLGQSALTYQAGVGGGTIRANALLTCNATTGGSLRAGAVFNNQTVQLCYFNLTILANTVPAQIAVPVGAVDLNWAADLRTVSSSVLGKIDGFKAPDDVLFAVIPTRAGSLIASGITSLSFAIRPAGKFNCPPLVKVVLASPSLTGSSPNQYYAVPVSLAAQPIIDYFTESNDLALGGVTTGPSPTQLAVSAELEISESSGVSTSDTINFVIFQSLVNPSPA